MKCVERVVLVALFDVTLTGVVVYSSGMSAGKVFFLRFQKWREAAATSGLRRPLAGYP